MQDVSGRVIRLYLLASHQGPLSLVVTLSSLYPASTVLLARVVLNSLQLATTARLNLNDNDLLIDYTGASPYDSVKGYVVTGRNSGAGIISTAGAEIDFGFG